MGVSCPSGPAGPTSAIWLGSSLTRYTKADPNHMAEVGPAGSDGKEIPIHLVYDQVALAAKYSQQDCRLDSLFDGIEEEFNQSN